jgi:hypothetical protein
MKPPPGDGHPPVVAFFKRQILEGGTRMDGIKVLIFFVAVAALVGGYSALEIYAPIPYSNVPNPKTGQVVAVKKHGGRAASFRPVEYMYMTQADRDAYEFRDWALLGIGFGLILVFAPFELKRKFEE